MTDRLEPDRLVGLEAFALELNAAAAAVTLPLFRSGLGVDDKPGMAIFDPVTAADRDTEAALRRLIAGRFPDHGVIGEEYGDDRPESEFVWVLDPVDGTRAFLAGLPLWTTLIGLRFRGEPVLGLIGQPFTDEIFVGSQALGSRLIRAGASRPLKTRACSVLTQATIASTDPQVYFDGAELGAWNQVRAAARIVRLGGDSYLFAMVALGAIDMVVESQLKAWDIDPIIPIIEGAGGLVTDWSGQRLGRHGGQTVAVGDRACLDEALVALRRSAQ